MDLTEHCRFLFTFFIFSETVTVIALFFLKKQKQYTLSRFKLSLFGKTYYAQYFSKKPLWALEFVLGNSLKKSQTITNLAFLSTKGSSVPESVLSNPFKEKWIVTFINYIISCLNFCIYLLSKIKTRFLK